MKPSFKIAELPGGFAIQDEAGNSYGLYKTRKEAQKNCDNWAAYYAEPLTAKPTRH